MKFQKGHKINLGKHHSEETKKKISEFQKNNNHEGRFTKEKPQLISLRNEKYRVPKKKINGKTYNLSTIVWCRANNIHRLPMGCVIHHQDLNPENNSSDNLQLMTKDFHTKLHHALIKFLI